MRIVVLPIDSRPCNTQFIQSQVEWSGNECVLPAAGELDDFRYPAGFYDSLGFLERELPGADALVISLDHWCYGSLLASRETLVQESEVLRRMDTLRSLLQKHPGKRVYMSSVIMRSSLSTLCRDDLTAYNAMTAFSIHTDRFARLGLAEDAAAIQEAMAKIPPDLLEKARTARKRNLTVNLAAADMAAEGLVTSLSFLQEDTQPEGIPRQDQAAIRRHIAEKGLTNVFLRNGTDEACAVHAAQALWEGHEPLDVCFRWLGDSGFIAPYEDHPFRENLESACKEIGLASNDQSDIVVLICCPEQGEQEEAGVPVSKEYLQRIAAEADACAEAGKRVYLLDVIRANGGVIPLMEMLTHPEGLWGYSAWNTASNAMGTLLSQIITDHLRGEPNRDFLAERLLDDWLYQGLLRHRLEEELEQEGEDVYCLTDKRRAEKRLRQMYQEVLPDCWPLPELPEYEISLPWQRIFEVKAEVI